MSELSKDLFSEWHIGWKILIFEFLIIQAKWTATLRRALKIIDKKISINQFHIICRKTILHQMYVPSDVLRNVTADFKTLEDFINLV